MEKFVTIAKIVLSVITVVVSAAVMHLAEENIGPMKYSGDQMILEFMASMTIFLVTLTIVGAIAIWELPDEWKSKQD